MDISQIGIMLFGAVAIILSQSRPSLQRYACLFGMAGQPFWFWTTYSHEQWGIFIMCFLYTYGWLKGFWIHWAKPWIQAHSHDPLEGWLDDDFFDPPPH